MTRQPPGPGIVGVVVDLEPDNIAQGYAVELEVVTDARQIGATHLLRFDDGTAEPLRIDGDAVLEKL